MSSPEAFTAQLRDALRQRPGAFLVGVAGLPGAGKTTLAAAAREAIPGCATVPMDGYHIPRAQLDAEGLRRRGARWTFDAAAFRADLASLRTTRRGVFPAFDHAEQDPRPGAIRVEADATLVIVEGLYVLTCEWALESLFDLRVFIDCDLDTALERVAARHLDCGLAPTLEAARDRAQSNDRLNALDVLADGCRERADLVFRTSP